MAILDAELRRGLAYVIPYKSRLAFILCLNLAGTALALYIPFLTRDLIDDALLGGTSTPSSGSSFCSRP